MTTYSTASFTTSILHPPTADRRSRREQSDHPTRNYSRHWYSMHHCFQEATAQGLREVKLRVRLEHGWALKVPMPFGNDSSSWTSSDRCGDKVNLHHQGPGRDYRRWNDGSWTVYSILRLEAWGVLSGGIMVVLTKIEL